MNLWNIFSSQKPSGYCPCCGRDNTNDHILLELNTAIAQIVHQTDEITALKHSLSIWYHNAILLSESLKIAETALKAYKTPRDEIDQIIEDIEWDT